MAKKNTTTAQRVAVTQIRSGIGHPKDQKECLKCLGLGRIGKSKEHTLTASTVGMLRKVGHLITVQAP